MKKASMVCAMLHWYQTYCAHKHRHIYWEVIGAMIPIELLPLL
jgi:hypothetical protein